MLDHSPKTKIACEGLRKRGKFLPPGRCLPENLRAGRRDRVLQGDVNFAVNRRLIQLIPHATSHAVLGPWLAAVP